MPRPLEDAPSYSELVTALEEIVNIVDYREHAFGEPEVPDAKYHMALHTWLNRGLPLVRRANPQYKTVGIKR